MSLTPSVDWHMGSEIVNQIGMQIHILYHTTTNSPWATPLHFHFEITKTTRKHAMLSDITFAYIGIFIRNLYIKPP